MADFCLCLEGAHVSMPLSVLIADLIGSMLIIHASPEVADWIVTGLDGTTCLMSNEDS